jgi:hypothetical protein
MQTRITIAMPLTMMSLFALCSGKRSTGNDATAASAQLKPQYVVSRCERKGQYNVAKLVVQYGQRGNMSKWGVRSTGDCPKRNAAELHERCDLICPVRPEGNDRNALRGRVGFDPPSTADIEEERRLLYVAMTRAKTHPYQSRSLPSDLDALRRNDYAGGINRPPSTSCAGRFHRAFGCAHALTAEQSCSTR